MNILVVEDNEITRDALTALLAQRGHTAYYAGSIPVAALQLAQADMDLMILDVILPHWDGATFLDELRKTAKWADLPVLVTSALRDDELRALLKQHWNSPSTAILKKPYEMDDLTVKMDGLTRGRAASARRYSMPDASSLLQCDAVNCPVRRGVVRPVDLGEIRHDDR